MDKPFTSEVTIWLWAVSIFIGTACAWVILGNHQDEPEMPPPTPEPPEPTDGQMVWIDTWARARWDESNYSKTLRFPRSHWIVAITMNGWEDGLAKAYVYSVSQRHRYPSSRTILELPIVFDNLTEQRVFPRKEVIDNLKVKALTFALRHFQSHNLTPPGDLS